MCRLRKRRELFWRSAAVAVVERSRKLKWISVGKRETWILSGAHYRLIDALIEISVANPGGKVGELFGHHKFCSQASLP